MVDLDGSIASGESESVCAFVRGSTIHLDVYIIVIMKVILYVICDFLIF